MLYEAQGEHNGLEGRVSGRNEGSTTFTGRGNDKIGADRGLFIRPKRAWLERKKQ